MGTLKLLILAALLSGCAVRTATPGMSGYDMKAGTIEFTYFLENDEDVVNVDKAYADGVATAYCINHWFVKAELFDFTAPKCSVTLDNGKCDGKFVKMVYHCKRLK
jgi:hypothetical protein